MNRIRTISVCMCAFINILLLLLPIFIIAQWLLIDWAPFKELVIKGLILKPVETPEGIVNLGNLTLTSFSKCIGILTSLIAYLPIWIGIFLLRILFKNYQCERIFAFENAKIYQKLAWLFFLNALLFKPLSELGMVLVATLSNPAGHRYVTLTFGIPNLEAIFCGIILITVSWVMIKGHALQSEQELTI